MSLAFTLASFSLSLLVLAGIARMRSADVALGRPSAVILTASAVVAIIWADHRGVTISITAAPTLACVVVCAASDLATGLIFDQVVAATTIAIVLAALVTRDVPFAAMGAGSCAGLMFVLHSLTKGRGIGLGDVKLSAVIGAGLGGVAAVGALGAAFVAGALFVIPLLMAKRARCDDRLAFAPFLAAGTIACAALGS